MEQNEERGGAIQDGGDRPGGRIAEHDRNTPGGDAGARLRELALLIEEGRRAQKIQARLQEQKRELQARESELHYQMGKEQRDVEQLEGRSLAKYFWLVTGRMDEKLDKERQEAYAAKVKYDAVVRELEALDKDIQDASRKAAQGREWEAEYQRLSQERKEQLRSSGTEEGEQILALEQELLTARKNGKELSEAISAGRAALSSAGLVLESLTKAADWGAWDMLGGGLVASALKYDHLDKAQGRIEQLQIQLNRFRTELADVEPIAEQLEVGSDSVIRFVDMFFDNIFVDWSVQRQIDQAKDQVTSVQARIRQTLSRLEPLAAEESQKEERIRERLDQIVLETTR